MSTLNPPVIPKRGSSKRHRELEDTMLTDLSKQKSFELDIIHTRKRIRARGSFDAEYWAGHKAVIDLQIRRHRLVRKISMSQFILSGGDEEQWASQDKAKELQEEAKEFELRGKLLDKQIERLSIPPEDAEKLHRKWVLELITMTPSAKGGVGVGDTLGQGARDSSKQSNFKAKLELVSNCKYPDQSSTSMWCPVQCAWMPESAMVAAHIFPYAAGQTAMDELFGRDESGKPEMFEPENGLLICRDAEKRIASGLIVLVPDVSDDPTELDAWTRAEVKEYKIRVFQPKHRLMKEARFATTSPEKMNSIWSQIDGQRVEFRSSFRPRARYLYWQFAVSLMRRAWQSDHRDKNVISQEFGKKFWGTGGPWIKRKHLLGFAEFLGHDVEWDNLMEAAKESQDADDNKPDTLGLAVACKQFRESRKMLVEEDDANEDDDEDEDSFEGFD